MSTRHEKPMEQDDDKSDEKNQLDNNTEDVVVTGDQDQEQKDVINDAPVGNQVNASGSNTDTPTVTAVPDTVTISSTSITDVASPSAATAPSSAAGGIVSSVNTATTVTPALTRPVTSVSQLPLNPWAAPTFPPFPLLTQTPFEAAFVRNTVNVCGIGTRPPARDRNPRDAGTSTSSSTSTPPLTLAVQLSQVAQDLARREEAENRRRQAEQDQQARRQDAEAGYDRAHEALQAHLDGMASLRQQLENAERERERLQADLETAIKEWRDAHKPPPGDDEGSSR